MAQEKLLELMGVGKRFGGTIALDNVDFDLYAGEVHGLVGENGAGKSTLMKILSGYHRDYNGEIFIKREKFHFNSTRESLAQGVGMIYQELSVIKTLSVAENIFLGVQPINKAGVVDWSEMHRIAQEHLKKLGINLNVKLEVGRYTVATQQMIEIARVIFSGALIIIMDEPTSALSHAEIKRLFDLIHNLKSQGKGIIFISHFLEDVLEISDRVTVLRNGRKIITANAKEISKEQLATAVLGREQEIIQPIAGRKLVVEGSNGKVVLEVQDLSSRGVLEGMNFILSKGEILGVYGSMGAGKSDLAECLFGLSQPLNGKILMDGKEVKIKNTSQARSLGIAFVPSDRRSTLFPISEIYKNITISHLKTISRGLLNQRKEISIARKQVEELGVRPPDPMRIISSLSGGNQQKVVIAKWLSVLPKVLILNDPTRGMDVGAKQEIMNIVQSLRKEGVATILMSSEPELVMSNADRVIVLKRGKQVAEYTNRELTKELLLSYAE